MRIEFEGQVHEFPDDFSDADISAALSGGVEAPKTPLFSTEGVKSTLRLVGPSLARGILGSQLAGLEEVQSAREAAKARGESVDETEDLPGQISIKRKAIEEADAEIARIRGNPTKPLEVAQGAVSSIASNAPGIAAAVATRNVGAPAAIPALQLAGEQTFGQEYATARAKNADIASARKHAGISAGAEVGFEMLPTSWLIKNLGKTGSVEFVSKYIARELATELPTTAVQKISERVHVEPDKPLGDFMQDLAQELVDTALVTPFAAGGTGAIAHLQARVGGVGRAKPAEDGGNKSDLSSPTTPTTPPASEPIPVADFPTAELNTPATDEVKALIESIDAELLDDAAETQAKEILAAVEKQQKAPPQPDAELKWAPLIAAPSGESDIGELQLGTTSKQANNAQNYINPNVGERLDRQFLFGPEGSVGLTPRQIAPQAGTYTLGQPSEDRGADYLEAVHNTVEQWRQQWMPDSTIVLSNEQLFSNAALGWHYSMGPKMHMIVPAVLRKPSKGLGAFNANTQASAFYNLSHEFGHALVLDRFYGANPEVANQLQAESKAGIISPKTATLLTPEAQAVVQEFNAIKQAILNNQLSAEQFANLWFSPGKLGQKNRLKDLGVAPTDNAIAVVKAIVRRTAQKSTIKEEIKSRALQERLMADYLSLDEYLAEQTARYAYQAKLDQNTPLGRFFKSALDSLRKFFTGLKKDGVIKPGTAFTEWIEGLSKGDRSLTEGDRVATAKKKGGTPTAAKTPAKKPAASTKKKVQTVQHNIDTSTEEGKRKYANSLIATLIRTKVLEANDPQAKELRELARNNDWAEFLDIYSRLAGKSVKFEIDDEMSLDFTKMHENFSVLRAGIPENQLTPEIRARAVTEWTEKQFRSSFFKAWFGDWENDPAGSSKIRRGAIIASSTAENVEIDTGAKNLDSLEHGNEPLVVFHSTKGFNTTKIDWTNHEASSTEAFERFNKGDIGFHFGTVRAAHNRAGYTVGIGEEAGPDNAPYQQDGLYIIPAALNMRNPLYVGSEMGTAWESPYLAQWLASKGILTQNEASAIKFEIERTFEQTGYEPYRYMAPLRDKLVSLGYDGIIYDNEVEGDVSFIVFHPNQVKSLLGSRTFSRSDNLHMELDVDLARPEGEGQRRLYRGVKDFMSDFPRFRRAMRLVKNALYSVVELQQLAHLNPDLSELAYMTEKNAEYNRYKSRLQAAADSVVEQWYNLGKENFAKINKFLLAEAEGNELWYGLEKTQVLRDSRPTTWYRYVPNAKTAEMAQRFGLDEELAELALRAKNVLLDQLNEAEQALLSVLGKRYANSGQQALTAAFIPVKRHVHQLRKQPFFPQGRFGNRVLIVEKQKLDGKGYEIVWREHFESAREWEKAWKSALANKAPDERVRKEQLTDQHYVLMALPLEFVDMAASELGLTDEQLDTLMNILQPVKRERVLSAYDQQRLGIKGYSADALRSFSDFTWHNANLLAKLIYRADFNLAIRGIGVKLREAKYSEDVESLVEVDRLQHIKKFMEKTRDYVMAPPNEAQQLRAAVSIMYLGMNVKTALLNTYGLITTWSDLTSRYGQIEGNKLFLKASRDTFKSIKLLSLNERKQGNYLSPESQEALDKALKEGVLSQSYAYHLAGMANAGNLRRLFPGHHAAARFSKNAVDVAMYVFRLTELSTRRATFLAQFEAARKQPDVSFEEAYREAVTRTNKLQNDYSLGNRAPFMRGFKLGGENPVAKIFEPIVPLATVFMTIVQHMGFHSYGGYELGERRMAKELGETPRRILGGYTTKLWIITLLLAGYEGLPGAENLLDLLEWAWRKWGGAKPLRQEIREAIQTLEIDPQFAARGLGHNVGGFDVSRSVGFGRMVPGTDTLAREHRDPEEGLGELVLDLFGPTGGLIRFGLQAVASDKSPAQAFERMPGGLGNIYVAYRWSQYGPRAPTGARVARDLESGELRDLTPTEIIGKALGFNPTVVAQEREVRFNQYDRKMYWSTRRQILMEDLWTATWQRDREAQADVKKAITEYNASVPAEYKQLRLSGADIARSMKARQRQLRSDEHGVSVQRRYRPIYEDVRESFE